MVIASLKQASYSSVAATQGWKQGFTRDTRQAFARLD
jgi:hypothetical protein